MSEEPPAIGSLGWIDLTDDDAEGLRDFYAQVVGWKPATVEMAGYCDFTMIEPETLEPAAGICHARGANAGLPPQWLIYIVVEDIRSQREAVRGARRTASSRSRASSPARGSASSAIPRARCAPCTSRRRPLHSAFHTSGFRLQTSHL